MAFRDVPLPPCISQGSEGAPVWMVDIARSPAGSEQRVGRRSTSLRRFNLGYNVRRENDMYEIMSHFEVMNGATYSFPLLDRNDYKSGAPGDPITSADAFLGTGDGVTVEFPIYKQYFRGNYSHSRRISLPVEGTVLVEINSILRTEGVHYEVDYERGIVTFIGGTVPNVGADVRAGFQFRCKVRFDTNDLSQAYLGYRTRGIANVPLIEVSGDNEVSEGSGS